MIMMMIQAIQSLDNYLHYDHIIKMKSLFFHCHFETFQSKAKFEAKLCRTTFCLQFRDKSFFPD